MSRRFKFNPSPKGEKSPIWTGGKRKSFCIDCDINICNGCLRCQKCNNTYQTGINHPNYKHGKTGNNKCLDCYKTISNGRIRCKSCENKRRVGVLANNWQGGVGFEPYTSEFNLTLKEQIRLRDKFKCNICHKVGIDVHHIDYSKDNCDKNNLITLCRNCHMRTNFDRDYWYAYFTYVITYYLKKGIK